MKDKMYSLTMTVARGMHDQLCSQAYPLTLPLAPNCEEGWTSCPIFKGTTGIIHTMSCHASVLTKNSIPHLPHTHEHEELLLMLSGEVDLLIRDENCVERIQHIRLKSGQFVYYPAYYPHTLQTVSDEPANYVMFKWYNERENVGSLLSFKQYSAFSQDRLKIRDGFDSQFIFEGTTIYLRKLHCHISTLTSGAGYEPHSDPYDVAIIVLEGEVETLGKKVKPFDVIFYRAGESHGMRNPGSETAKYIVFEFHNKELVETTSKVIRIMILLIKYIVPPLWRWKLRRFIGRLLKKT